jgi:hypothetical protein
LNLSKANYLEDSRICSNCAVNGKDTNTWREHLAKRQRRWINRKDGDESFFKNKTCDFKVISVIYLLDLHDKMVKTAPLSRKSIPNKMNKGKVD